MNRHHPYGGSFEGPSGRRGGSPSGPGPDRHRFHDKGGPPHRGGRGGFGRGRGGGGGSFNGNYDGPMGHNDPYDQPYPQGNEGYYNGYEAPQQAPYYQNSYGGGGPPGPYGPPPGGLYNQDYGRFEDGPGPGPAFDGPGPQFDDGYMRGGGGGGGRKGFRRDRGETKVVDEAVIEERIQREKPCRTLFIRNIKYETDSADVRRQFEEHGDIKTFFDLISTRGMVFVTYFDLRAAERARDRLQGSEIGGRPIDVHYSLPRDDARGDREKNQQLQGTIQLTLRNSVSGAPLDDNEVRRKFQPFGDVKSVRPANDRPDSRYIEFYDMRAAEEAFERLRHQPIQDGVMDIVLSWDPNDNSQNQGGGGGGRDHGRGGGDWGDDGYRGGGGRGRGRGGKGGYGRGRGGHGGGNFENDRRGPIDDGYGGRHERGGPRGRGGRFEDDGYGGGGRGRGGGYGGDRFDSRSGPGYGPPPDMNGPGGYGPPPGDYPPGPPPPIPPQAGGPPVHGDDRLEQARKVQQLLAALKQPGGAPGSAPPGPPGAPGMPPPPTGMGMQPPNATPAPGYYNQPPLPPSGMGYPPGPPPPNPGMYPPPPSTGIPAPGQSSTPQPGAPAPGLENLPPNLLAMLQAAQRAPPGAPNGYPATNGQPSNPQYQALMGYLQQQQQQQASAKQ